ncbi:4-hydroxyphenylpyruvate dioxygenase [Natronospira bacteriovora]|uniref:4-hydroxyphenylpyruvate dioxygenase n=1 Tax=Natronospira bacteriovora TaxID=3069753 RepID=A0ABU0W8M6_9GAMM|nr:4-hydroxyphenylpyruvate dioxygenase [Natronospira sp. AB-CW4]MDQ2070392.1 4-hydroxyphenylpyruvate dioxygenase [Natronospira sp. AB-CW4]
MSEQYDNPMGTDGFDFVEYAAPEPQLLHDLFKAMGFTAVAKHKKRNVTLYRQNDSNFLVNEEPGSFAEDFAREHGPCATGFAIRVKDADHAIKLALEKGATQFGKKPETLAVDAPAIEGIGGSALYLVDQYGDQGDLYEDQFDFFEGVEKRPKGFGLDYVDHLTHNVHYGNMDEWCKFYEDLFNFRQIRYFDIKGKKTGLNSRAMTSPDGMVRIPINESSDDKSQIVEYLNEYNGEGIQHIALFTDNIYDTVENLRSKGIDFLDTPDAYYELIDERIPNHGQPVDKMQDLRLLIDADQEHKDRLLLQIFTKNVIGPIFFEIIQRKGNEGFGEGNFTALFEAIERDQEKRGVL